jgi:hypothetical protein
VRLSWFFAIPLVQDAKFDCVRNLAQITENLFAVRGADVGDGIADGFRGFQILAEDIGFVRGEDLVELREHPGNIFVNVDEAVGVSDFRKLDMGKIHAVQGAAVARVVDDSFRDEGADILLRFFGAAGDVRREDNLVHALQRRGEFFAVGLGLAGKDVERRGADFAGFDGFSEGFVVDNEAAAGVEENDTGLHLTELFATDETVVFRAAVDVNGDNVGEREKLGKRAAVFGIAEDELDVEVVEVDVHTEGFGEHGKLGANFSIADNAQLFAANFVAASGGFVPGAAMEFLTLGEDAAREEKNFAENDFHHAARAAVRRVENGDAGAGAGGQVDLVGADAEGADGDEFRGRGEDLGSDVRLGANAENGHAGEFTAESVFLETLRQGFNLATARAEARCGSGMEVFEKQDFGFRIFHRYTQEDINLSGAKYCREIPG